MWWLKLVTVGDKAVWRSEEDFMRIDVSRRFLEECDNLLLRILWKTLAGKVLKEVTFCSLQHGFRGLFSSSRLFRHRPRVYWLSCEVLLWFRGTPCIWRNGGSTFHQEPLFRKLSSVSNSCRTWRQIAKGF